MSKKEVKKKVFDKYDYYFRAVQSADTDVIFLRDLYHELRHQYPYELREDFCGTFAISCEWVKLNRQNRASGIDIDPEPISYGRENYLSKLIPEQAARIKIVNSNVLLDDLPKADIVAAFNFSHYIFKQKEDLKKYFSSSYRHLKAKGILVVDAFGGKLCHNPNVEKTRHKGFVYEWEQESFNEINHHAKFHINFKLKNEKRTRRHVFSYDWRLWTLPELQDIMKDVGFKEVHVYWEQSDASGEGTGHFVKETKSDDCDAWVAYVVGAK